MARKDVDDGLAVAELPKRSPTEIAADAAARSEEMRRASRLKLPEGSLAAHVAVLEQDKRLHESVANQKELGAKAEARSPLLQKELEAARRRVAELVAEADANFYTQADVGHLTHRVGEHRQKNPLLFAPVELLAERLISEVAR
jgi:hypothetical protein